MINCCSIKLSYHMRQTKREHLKLKSENKKIEVLLITITGDYNLNIAKKKKKTSLQTILMENYIKTFRCAQRTE